MSRKKISTTVYLDPEQVIDLAALSKATKVPQAVYVREAIDDVLKKHRDKIPAREADPRQTSIFDRVHEDPCALGHE